MKNWSERLSLNKLMVVYSAISTGNISIVSNKNIYKTVGAYACIYENHSAPGTYTILIEDSFVDSILGILLVHECSHYNLEHMKVKDSEEKTDILRIATAYGKSLSDKDIHDVLNICMDMEINTSILSKCDLSELSTFTNPVHQDTFPDIIPGLKFRDYYEPVIKHFKPQPSIVHIFLSGEKLKEYYNLTNYFI
jgi:predicted metal-dependent peptidase